MLVQFAVLGKIGGQGTYCASDTNWKKGRRPGQDQELGINEVKARLMLEPVPGMEPEFDLSKEFMRRFTNENNVHDKEDVFCGNPKGRRAIPITHPFFEQLNKAETKYSDTVYEWLNDGLVHGMSSNSLF
jgi:hypothetical protein